MRPRLKSIGLDAVAEFLLFSRDLEKGLESYLSPHDLSLSRFSVLAAIYRSGAERVTPSQIAALLLVTRATMTGLIDGLEEAGFITRDYRADDRRQLYVVLSPKGTCILEKLLPDLDVALTKIVNQLNGLDLQKLLTNLAMIRVAVPLLMGRQKG
jgi:MarR family transcriptional regulator, negative regulator of the multidrug operon emrRAB